MLAHTGTDHYCASSCAYTCCVNSPLIIMSHSYAAAFVPTLRLTATKTCMLSASAYDATCSTRCHTGLTRSWHVVRTDTTTMRLQTRVKPFAKAKVAGGCGERYKWHNRCSCGNVVSAVGTQIGRVSVVSATDPRRDLNIGT